MKAGRTRINHRLITETPLAGAAIRLSLGHTTTASDIHDAAIAIAKAAS